MACYFREQILRSGLSQSQRSTNSNSPTQKDWISYISFSQSSFGLHSCSRLPVCFGISRTFPSVSALRRTNAGVLTFALATVEHPLSRSDEDRSDHEEDQEEVNPAERGRAAAQLVRERVDSSPETHLRLLLVLAGLPEPVVNLEVPGAEPGKIEEDDQAHGLPSWLPRGPRRPGLGRAH